VDWIILIVAGMFEIGFTTSMKLSDDFSKPWPTLSFLACSILSFVLLSRATRTIPMGTAYAVWTGIGAFGTAAIGILFFKDPITFWRIVFLLGLLGCILGLKLVAAH
jgi:quaternary ammonium compound-resistance protein SugE